MARRELQEINAGSMADIAFLLLIFFLVTTTMDMDVGIMRQLPPIEDVENPPEVKQKDVYVVLVNKNNQLLVEGEEMSIENLKDGTIKFLTNSGVFKDAYNDPDLTERLWVRKQQVSDNIQILKQKISSNPENVKDLKTQLNNWEEKSEAIDIFGEYKELKGSAVISLQNDKGTSYDTYIQVQNELSSAVNQLRDELSMKYFNKTYEELNDKDPDEKKYITAIRKIFPQRVSEAEPVTY